MVTRGLASIRLAPGLRIAAPRSGLRLGSGPDGPVTLRLFRPAGTRLAAIAALDSVQVLVARAAAAGVLVRVLTARPPEWQPFLGGGADAAAVPPGTQPAQTAGPAVVVDDSGGAGHRLGDAGPWRCRIDLRAPRSAAELRAVTAADVLLVGALPADLALAAASGMGVGVPDLSRLTALSAGTVAVLVRGAIEYVSLDGGAKPAPQPLPTALRMSP